MSDVAPEIIILRELLEAEPEFVSGSTLAEKLGMSRVGVWAYMEKLRKQGFGFEAIRSRGYRIILKPNGLHVALVEAQLRARPRKIALYFQAEVDSTSSEAERLLAEGKPTPFVVLATRQLAGRGRLGRTWHSEANGNLYTSFAFRPKIEPARMQTFTLWMGINICELIENFCHVSPGLKWPNDLVFDGRKAGGMLTEARMDSDHIRDLIFGLGLNVNGRSASMPSALSRSATSLAEFTGQSIDLNRFAAALIGRVAQAYDQFVESEDRDGIIERWDRRDVLRGKQVSLIQGDKKFTGIASGIDDEGSLLVRQEEGKSPLRFRAGEVTIEKGASPA